MNIGPETTLRELAFIVCSALDRHGATAVLSGGGAATIYAPDAYQSRDLDFIFSSWSVLKHVSDAPLIELGFELMSGTYRHSLTPYTIDFPVGPLAIGSEVITCWDTMHEGQYLLHVISPTDCVRDRLAWFLFNNDFSSLEQALAVAGRHNIDLDLVGDWCEREGESAKFGLFSQRLAKPS